MYIQYNEGETDPIVFGTKNNKRYLIARWGAELKSLVALRKIAVERWIHAKRAEVKKNLAELSAFGESLEEQAEKFFDGGYVSAGGYISG